MSRATTIVAAFLLVAGVAGAGNVPPVTVTGPVEDRTRVCNMQDTVQAQPGLAREYEGRTYHFCCEGCANSFTGDPKKYAYAHDPVSGAEVDKAQALMFAVNNHIYYFANAKTRAAFAKDPSKYLKGS